MNGDKPEDYVNEKHPLKEVGNIYQGLSKVDTNEGEVLFNQKSGDTIDSNMKYFPGRN